MYLWLVFVHLIGLVVFLLGHGASIACSFRLRRKRERIVIVALPDLSRRANQAGMLGLILLAIGGLAAAWNANQLTASWVVGSYVVLIAVIAGMYAIGAPFYYGLRDAVACARGAAPIGDAELIGRLDNRQPEILTAIGGAGLVVLVWLMAMRPA
jgi:hypothetical protein